MTWLFERGADKLSCEVRRADAHFEIFISGSDGLTAVHSIDSARELVERMQSMPQTLIQAGWQPCHARSIGTPKSAAMRA